MEDGFKPNTTGTKIELSEAIEALKIQVINPISRMRKDYREEGSAVTPRQYSLARRAHLKLLEAIELLEKANN